MTDPRARRGVPDRWLLPPPPREPHVAERWRAAGFDERRRWARLGEGGLANPSERDAEVVVGDAELVVGLARARLATSWRLLAGAPILGWLVLMTVWGFGRSTYPERAQLWLLAGAALGSIVWTAAAVHAASRLRRARALVAAADDHVGNE